MHVMHRWFAARYRVHASSLSQSTIVIGTHMSKSDFRFVMSAIAGALATIAAPAMAQNTLSAISVANPPKLSALAADPAWSKAPELKFKASGGANFADGSTSVSLK